MQFGTEWAEVLCVWLELQQDERNHHETSVDASIRFKHLLELINFIDLFLGFVWNVFEPLQLVKIQKTLGISAVTIFFPTSTASSAQLTNFTCIHATDGLFKALQISAQVISRCCPEAAKWEKENEDGKEQFRLKFRQSIKPYITSPLECEPNDWANIRKRTKEMKHDGVSRETEKLKRNSFGLW